MRLSFHGRWTKDQSQLHINILEIMAIRLALKKAIQYIHHKYTDNTTVVSYINKQGGTHSPNPCIEMGNPPLVPGTRRISQNSSHYREIQHSCRLSRDKTNLDVEVNTLSEWVKSIISLVHSRVLELSTTISRRYE